MNEFDIIRRYFDRPARDPAVLVGVGDDAAVLSIEGRVAVTVDTLLEGAVSLSDVAAMGARPRWATLALTLRDADPAWLEAFAAGFFSLAERYGVTLVGGNLTRGPLAITVEVTGDFPGDEPALMRSGARAGDDVYVTGSLGDAAGGLERLTAGGRDLRPDARSDEPSPAAVLAERYLRPMPRVEAGQALAGVATAAIDISDGLASDLAHVCDASGCGALVDVESLPLSPALGALFAPDAALRLALSGGDDYELCFTAAPESRSRIADALARCGTSFRRIGRMTEERGIEWRRAGERFDPQAGYLHFK